jgi:hypothetical protein
MIMLVVFASNLLLELRILLIELAHFGFSAPADIAGSGFQKIGLCYFFEAACRVEASGRLVRDRLILDESVGPRGLDCLLVKTHCFQFTRIEVSGLRSNQFILVREAFWAAFSPPPERAKLRHESLAQFSLPLWSSGRNDRRERQRVIRDNSRRIEY